MRQECLVEVWAGSCSASTGLKGEWIQLPVEPAALNARLHEIDPAAAEWSCFDWSSNKMPAVAKQISGFADPRAVNEALQPLTEWPASDWIDEVDAVVGCNGCSVAEALAIVEDGRVIRLPVETMSPRDVGEYVADETGIFDKAEKAGIAPYYIDFEAIGRDYLIEACIVETQAGIFELLD